MVQRHSLSQAKTQVTGCDTSFNFQYVTEGCRQVRAETVSGATANIKTTGYAAWLNSLLRRQLAGRSAALYDAAAVLTHRSFQVTHTHQRDSAWPRVMSPNTLADKDFRKPARKSACLGDSLLSLRSVVLQQWS